MRSFTLFGNFALLKFDMLSIPPLEINLANVWVWHFLALDQPDLEAIYILKFEWNRRGIAFWGSSVLNLRNVKAKLHYTIHSVQQFVVDTKVALLCLFCCVLWSPLTSIQNHIFKIISGLWRPHARFRPNRHNSGQLCMIQTCRDGRAQGVLASKVSLLPEASQVVAEVDGLRVLLIKILKSQK